MTRLHLVWWLTCVGCSVEGEREVPEPPAPKIDKIGDMQLDVIVNNLKVATLSTAQLRRGVRLDELLGGHPYLGWTSIASLGDNVGPVEWLDPVVNYAGLVPLAFLDHDKGALALVDPSHLDQRDTADPRVAGIDEVRIVVPKRKRTPAEALAVRCAPEQKGEDPVPPPGPKRWKGTSYQFNIPMHWRNRMALDLADLVDRPINAKIGTIVSDAVEWEHTCTAALYRIPDRHGRHAAIARVTSGSFCVDSIVEFACEGADLKLWAYYADSGLYVENGVYKPAP